MNNNNNKIIHLEDQKTFKSFCRLSENELNHAYFKRSYNETIEQQKKYNDFCPVCLNNLKINKQMIEQQKRNIMLENNKKTFQQINFNPYNNNVLDYVDNENLYTIDNKKVKINHFIKFTIEIEGKENYITDNNIQASYYLNINEVGFYR